MGLERSGLRNLAASRHGSERVPVGTRGIRGAARGRRRYPRDLPGRRVHAPPLDQARRRHAIPALRGRYELRQRQGAGRGHELRSAHCRELSAAGRRNLPAALQPEKRRDALVELGHSLLEGLHCIRRIHYPRGLDELLLRSGRRREEAASRTAPARAVGDRGRGGRVPQRRGSTERDFLADPVPAGRRHSSNGGRDPRSHCAAVGWRDRSVARGSCRRAAGSVLGLLRAARAAADDLGSARAGPPAGDRVSPAGSRDTGPATIPQHPRGGCCGPAAVAARRPAQAGVAGSEAVPLGHRWRALRERGLGAPRAGGGCRQPVQSAHRAGDGEPRLAVRFRPRARRDAR